MNKCLARELTQKERSEIKKLVTSMCANYDKEYGCLPLDYGRCYMLDKCWTGSLCKYFKNAVLPLNPELEASLNASPKQGEKRICSLCGKQYDKIGKQKYCSAYCSKKANQNRSRERMRKTRENKH